MTEHLERIADEIKAWREHAEQGYEVALALLCSIEVELREIIQAERAKNTIQP